MTYLKISTFILKVLKNPTRLDSPCLISETGLSSFQIRQCNHHVKLLIVDHDQNARTCRLVMVCTDCTRKHDNRYQANINKTTRLRVNRISFLLEQVAYCAKLQWKVGMSVLAYKNHFGHTWILWLVSVSEKQQIESVTR